MRGSPRRTGTPLSAHRHGSHQGQVINGVRALIVWDLDYTDGKLEESELVFFAQDKGGNVWLLGELNETYDKLNLVGGKTWLAGMDGSRAGIMMKADPRRGTPSYSEGYG